MKCIILNLALYLATVRCTEFNLIFVNGCGELCDIFMKLVAAPAAAHQCYVNGSVIQCKGVVGTRRELLYFVVRYSQNHLILFCSICEWQE